MTLNDGWQILQDVYDSAERLGLQLDRRDLSTWGPQISEWEPLDRLEHLQTVFASTPYWGRELRYFNHAPWWYRREFELDVEPGALTIIRFSNVDYFCRVWLNGELIGDHEGYSAPFEFDVSGQIAPGRNVLIVKVWSPWDDEVRDEQWEWRYVFVRRDMVKGTYEHDDGFVARDVNPVGIYGTVTVSTFPRYRIGEPRVEYDLDPGARSATVRVSGEVTTGVGELPQEVTIQILAPDGSVAASGSAVVTEGGGYAVEWSLSDVLLWETWDRGTPHLHTVVVGATHGRDARLRFGFRTIALLRDEDQVMVMLNGRPFFVRGTSYYPDAYVSRMDEARYRRDLEAARAAGFNLLRVHVHVEKAEFYELCDELGFGVIQDSEFNWTHPDTDEWTERMVAVYSDTIRMLIHRPAVLIWICLNEPTPLDDVDDFLSRRPGPQLVEAVRALDPSRPLIKGSGVVSSDPDSGDSHNYLGSLSGVHTRYTDIDGTDEQLNTEFGFDAPGSVANLATTGKLGERLAGLFPSVSELQHYQYRLLKYYIEHYRAQRFRPNSGYVHFMFIDLCPQSFYGVYDWWGTPKPGLRAFEESNQPRAVILEQTASETVAIWFVNDTLTDVGEVHVAWTATDEKGVVIANGLKAISGTSNAQTLVAPLHLTASLGRIDLDLIATDADGVLVATNAYRGLFDHPPHPAGHPARFSPEFGVRIYSA
jgi:beta-mannosidase